MIATAHTNNNSFMLSVFFLNLYVKTLLYVFGIAQHQNSVTRYKACFRRKI